MAWRLSLKLISKLLSTALFSSFSVGLFSQVALHLTYEQFDTEITAFAELTNNNDSVAIINAFVLSKFVDFSGYANAERNTKRVEIKPGEKTRIVISSLEYSVLSEADVHVGYIWNNEATQDSLNFDFPNKFKSVDNKDVEIDLGGLKIDRTRTPVGRYFIERFEQKYESPEGFSDYTIIFEELPFRFRTTILRVYLNNELILENYLNDKEEFLNGLVNYVIGIIKYKLQSESQRNDELGGGWNGI